MLGLDKYKDLSMREIYDTNKDYFEDYVYNQFGNLTYDLQTEAIDVIKEVYGSQKFEDGFFGGLTFQEAYEKAKAFVYHVLNYNTSDVYEDFSFYARNMCIYEKIDYTKTVIKTPLAKEKSFSHITDAEFNLDIINILTENNLSSIYNEDLEIEYSYDKNAPCIYTFFDLETTGIPLGKYKGNFHEHHLYERSRVVQATFTETLVSGDTIKVLNKITHTIKPRGFFINNSQIHGITHEDAETNGISFEMFVKKITPLLKRSSVIVSHNIVFDFNVFMAELFEHSLFDAMFYLMEMYQLCTLDIAKNSSYGFKNNKLKTIYKHFGGLTEKSEFHTSEWDTDCCIFIYSKMKGLTLIDNI